MTSNDTKQIFKALELAPIKMTVMDHCKDVAYFKCSISITGEIHCTLKSMVVTNQYNPSCWEVNPEDIDHSFTGEITCPWCGHKEETRSDWTKDSGENTCDECGKNYNWYRNIEVTYSTDRVEDK